MRVNEQHSFTLAPKRKPATRAGFHERHWIPAFAEMTYLR